MVMPVNPARIRPPRYSAKEGAPAMQPTWPPRCDPLRRGEVVGGQDVGDAQPPAGPQDPEALGEHGGPVGRQVDHAVGDDHVHRAVRQRDRLDLAAEEHRVARAGLARVGPGQVQHLAGHVQAVRRPGRADPAGRQQHVDAAPGAQVQHRLPGTQVGHRDRVAAAEAGPHRAAGQAAGVRVPGRAEAACRERVRFAVGDRLARLRGPREAAVPGPDRLPDLVTVSWLAGLCHGDPPDGRRQPRAGRVRVCPSPGPRRWESSPRSFC